MIRFVLLLFLYGSDCWTDYDECAEPCRSGLDACWIAEGWRERIVCMSGPAVPGSVQWCRLDMWPSTVGGGFVAVCTDTLPRWCRGNDYDLDGDVDMRDVAKWMRGYRR